MTGFALKDCLEAMGLMVQVEMAVADFYLGCLERFPEDASFWSRLAKEELAHADIIAKLAELVRVQPNEFTIGNSVPLNAINSFTRRIRSNVDEIRHGELAAKDALLIAYHIENTVIEMSYVQVINTNNQTYLSLMNNVMADTMKHKKRVVKKLSCKDSLQNY
jgi:tRNA U55 pseudouridine synthase TruB